MVLFSVFFFFKQKTAYEMRISDWSSDVCSSDLHRRRSGHDGGGRGRVLQGGAGHPRQDGDAGRGRAWLCEGGPAGDHAVRTRGDAGDRKCVVEGTRVSVGGDLGGRRQNIINSGYRTVTEV